jgi:acetylglutamate kinase
MVQPMNAPVSKAAVLHEALPYIRRFHGRTFVVKYGGHAMVDDELKQSFAKDVCLLRYVGIQVVVVHGGGPQIDATLAKMGIESRFESGLRITDEQTMNVVEMVLAGSVNSDIVGLICAQGGRALGLSGRDDGFMRAKTMTTTVTDPKTGNKVPVDLGRVGAVSQVNPKLVTDLCTSGFVPVIAPIAVDADGRALNVNADLAASALAQALGAAKLVLMTDVEGVLDKDKNHLTSMGASDATQMIENGTIRGGMIPKVECALEAVNNGVEKVHIIDGRKRHALLLEIFTDSGVGTEIHRDRVS